MNEVILSTQILSILNRGVSATNNIMTALSECTTYAASDSRAAKALAKRLSDAGIKNAIVTNNINENTTVWTSKEDKAAADRIVDEFNEEIVNSELCTKDFTMKYIGQNVELQDSLNKEAIELIRRELRGTGTEFCVREMKPNIYQLLYPERSRIAVERAVLQSTQKLNGEQGEKYRQALSRKETTREEAAVLATELKGKATLYIADAFLDEQARYKVNSVGLFSIGKDGEKDVLLTKRSAQGFSVQIKAIVTMMDAPIIKCMNEDEASRKDVFVRKETMTAKSDMSLFELDQNTQEQGVTIASDVLYLCAFAGNVELDELRDALSHTDRISEVSSLLTVSNELQERIDDLVNKYNSLGLTGEQDKKVMTYAENAYIAATENRTSLSVRATDMTISDFGSFLDTIESHGNEPVTTTREGDEPSIENTGDGNERTPTDET